MNINNPLQMNNWELKKLLTVVLSVQSLVLCTMVLDALNLHIPILRELICFIYLTFIPGILILRVLKLNNLSNIQSILFAIGLSLATLMFTGFFINLIYPFIWITKPISIVPVVTTITLVVLTLSVLCFVRDDKLNDSNLLNIDSNELIIGLALILIPFSSIFGSYLMNGYNNNSIQIFYLLLISTFPIATLKWIPKKLFPLTVFVISLSLLLHTALISNYIWGADINIESNIANFVLNNMIWNFNIPETTNAMLSLTTLAPIYSIFLNMSVQWVYKVVYPILFSFVPLGLFLVYKKQFGSKIAFLSIFFFMASFIFYNGMPALARQEIAEIFLIIILILIVTDNISRTKKYLLLSVFSISLILSHYGLAYLLLILMIFSFIILKTPLYGILDLSNKEKHYKLINKKFIFFFICFTLLSYAALATASNIFTVTQIGLGILILLAKTFDPNYSSALFISTAKMPLFQSIERYIFLGAQGLTLIGAIALIKYKEKLKELKIKINPDYELLMLSSVIFAILAVFLPAVSDALQSDRLYHILQFFIAPLFTIGAIILIEFLAKLTKKVHLINKKKLFYAVSIFLSIFFIFNSALIYEIAGQNKVGSFALNKNTDFLILNDKEISAAKWLNNKEDPDIVLYADVNKANVLSSIVNAKNITELTNPLNYTQLQNSYIYLGSFNLKNNKLFARRSWNKVEYIQKPNFNESLIIYSNKGSYILKE